MINPFLYFGFVHPKNFKKIRYIKSFGDSMSPFLMDGDIVYFKKIPFKRVKVDDLVGFLRGNMIVVHRVVYKSPDFLITKGDANLKPDKKVYPKDILGIVERVKRNGKILDTKSLYLFQSSIYFSEIVKITELLQKNKINFVILKGLPLHLYYQKEHPRRIYVDCDLLVEKQHYLKLSKILKKQGYIFEDHSLNSTLKKLKKKNIEVSFSKTVNHFRIVFDVHLEAVFLMTQLGSLDPLYPQKMLDLFSRRLLENKQTIKIQGKEFPILSIEDLIIYLALHLFHHNFKGYFRYELLKAIINSKKIDYASAARTIHNFKLNNYVYPVFLNLYKFYRITPEIFLKNIEPSPKIKKISKQFLGIEVIFEDELRIGSGVKRFKLIFMLSPFPLIKKSLVIFNREVLYSVYWVVKGKLLFAFNKYIFTK